MPRRSGFYMFMEERRPAVLQSGRTLTGGRKELSELVSDEWRGLPQEEKDRYCDLARKFNEQKGYKPMEEVNKTLLCRGSKDGSPESVAERQANRQCVEDLFRKRDWLDHPIVVCSFTVYFDPTYDGIYFPAEVGLATFSIREGVLDNYGRIIDPGEVPLGYGTEVAKTIEVLGLPHPGLGSSEFAEFEPLMLTLRSYLEKYRGSFHPQEEFVVFAMDCDFELVSHCFEWLNMHTGYTCPTRVLSLSLFTYLASNQSKASNPGKGDPSQGPSSKSGRSDKDKEAPPPIAPTYTVVSGNRQVGVPLNECFVYPSTHPLTKYGIFFNEKEVDDVVKSSDNYKYYEELCCVYHFKTRDGIFNCALNMSNRYAYNILEFLTVSNEVDILPGGHYPEVSEAKREKCRRQDWLRKWGITQLEVDLEDPPEVQIRAIQMRPFNPRFRRAIGEDGGEEEMGSPSRSRDLTETEGEEYDDAQGSSRSTTSAGADYEDSDSVTRGGRHVRGQQRNPYRGRAPRVYSSSTGSSANEVSEADEAQEGHQD